MVEIKEMEKLPEGWKRVRLGEVAEKLKAGGTPSRDVSEYWGGDLPFALIEDLTKIKYLYATSETINYKGLKNSSAWIVPKNSILLSIYASLGEVVINKIDVATNQAILGIILKNNYDLEFIYYVLKFNKHNFERYTIQTTQKNLNKELVSKFVIFVPKSKEEQRKIAEILETVDNTIEKTDKIIEKYKRIKQGLMQDLLTKGIDENGQIRSEKTHKFKDSPLGRIPEEWEVVRLGEVGDVKGGKRLPKGERLIDDNTGYPYIRLTDINILNQSINVDTVKFISKSVKRKIKRYVISKDDIMISIAGTIGLIALIPINLDGANLTENAAKLTNIKECFDKKFLAYYLSFYKVKKQIEFLTGVVAQPKLALFRIKQILLPLPPLPEQHRIASILSQIDETIEKEQKYKEKLERVKRGLMEDLLTGKIRVNHLIEDEKNVS